MLSPDPVTVACAEAVSCWRLVALDFLGPIRASSKVLALEQVGGLGWVAFSGVAPF